MTTEAQLGSMLAAARAGYKPPDWMFAHPMVIRAFTAERARRGDIRAIAKMAAWRAEDALNRYFAACRIAYSEGRAFHGRPAAAQL